MPEQRLEGRRDHSVDVSEVRSEEDRDLEHIMYEVPGYGPPNIERYLKALDRFRDELERLEFQEKLDLVSDDTEKERILREKMFSEDLQWKRVAIEAAAQVDSTSQSLQSDIDTVVSRMSAGKSMEAHLYGARLRKYTSDDVSRSLEGVVHRQAQYHLSEDSVGSLRVGAQMISTLPTSLRFDVQVRLAECIERDLRKGSAEKAEDSVDLIRYVEQEQKVSLIAQALHSHSSVVRSIASGMLKGLRPTTSVEGVLHQALHAEDPVVTFHAAEAVTRLYRTRNTDPDVPQNISESITQNVRKALHASDDTTRRLGARMLKFVAQPEQLPLLIRDSLMSEDDIVRSEAIKAIRYIDTGVDRASDMLDAVEAVFNSGDVDMQLKAIAVARHIPFPEKERASEKSFQIIEHLLSSAVLEERIKGAQALYYLNHNKAPRLFEKVESDPTLLNALFYSRLFPEDSEFDPHAVFPRRVDFEKTGSQMTVLRGGSLERKMIIRHMRSSAFVSWKKAFEAREVWLERGFDYVPVEPIQSFLVRKEHTIDAFAAVLDIDLKHWLVLSGGRFKDELQEERQRIIEQLQEMGIRHGDVHEGNFFLQFSRTEDGRMNTSAKPNVYVGDFDKAAIKRGRSR